MNHLGATTAEVDNAARAIVASKLSVLISEWTKRLDDAIAGRLGVLTILTSGVVAPATLAQQRMFLEQAKKQVQGLFEIAQPIIYDPNLSVSEVVNRVEDFAQSYGDTLDQQIRSSLAAAGSTTFRGRFEAFRVGLHTVLQEIVTLVPPPGTSSGNLLVAAGVVGGLVAVAYIWRSFR